MAKTKRIAWNKDKKFPHFVWNKGKHLSEEIKKKISKGKIGQRNHLGFKNTEEAKKRMSKTHIGQFSRERNPNWQGGISFEPYTTDWNETLKRAIRERDNYICQLCSQYGNYIHHIDYNKKNCNSENLITLCRKCHMKTNYNRTYWLNYFHIPSN